MSTKIFAKHIIRIKEAILINNYLDTFIYTPTIFAGTGVPGFNNMWPANPQNPLGDVPLPIAQINHPRGLSADYLGNLYFADEYNGCVRMVTRDDAGAWVIRTIAGDGNEAGSGNPPEDGPAFGMELYEPMDVDVSAHCHYVVFLNTDSHMVHLLEMNHEHEPWIHHIAGIYNPGGGGYVQPGSGLAKEARFKYPQGIAITKDASTIYVADSQNHVIRKLTKVQEGEWMIEPFAGTTAAGYGGDGGHALAAMLYEPIGIALDEAEQNLYIADMRNHRIRKINLLSWLITTVAGNGQMPPNQYTNVNDGTVFELGASLNAVALFKYPSDVAIDANGNLYVADYEHNRIRKIRADLGEIRTIYGDGYTSTIAKPRGITLNWAGEAFASDTEGARIWKLTPDGFPSEYPEAPLCADEPLPVEVVFEANKTAVGAPLEAGLFEFGLYDENDNLIGTATNDAGGLVNFPPFAIRQIGIHIFTIRELGLSPFFVL